MQLYHISNRTLHWHHIEWLLNTSFSILRYLKGNHYLQLWHVWNIFVPPHCNAFLLGFNLVCRYAGCKTAYLHDETNYQRAVLVDDSNIIPTPDPFCGHTGLELSSSFPYELLIQFHATPIGIWKFVSCLFGDENLEALGDQQTNSSSWSRKSHYSIIINLPFHGSC